MGLSETLAKVHFRNAVEFTRKGDIANAVDQYQHAIKADPRNALYHNQLGLGLFSLGNYDAGYNEMAEAIRLEPNNAKFHSDIAMYYNLKRRYDESIRECKVSLSLADNGNAHNNLAAAYRSKGLVDDAILESRKAICLGPNVALYHASLAETLVDKGLLDEALAENKIALSLEPTNKFYLLLLEKITKLLNAASVTPPQTTVQVKEVIREIVKVPCTYCGTLVEITATKCPSCGAPFSR